MKKFLVILLSIILALLLSELTVRYVIGYPAYGISHRVHYRTGGDYWSNVRKPYSKYWNVEGGNKVFHVNNLGLPGVDIDLNKKDRLAVLGSSMVEAFQLKPSLIATSVLDSLLKSQNSDLAAYNLGYSFHDPYDSWFRLEYYQQLMDFKYVVLVLNADNTDWFKRHPQPFSFEKDGRFGSINKSKVTNLKIKIRNSSAFISVVNYGFSRRKKNNGDDAEPELMKKRPLDASNELTRELTDCIQQFNSKYAERFVLVSIIDNDEYNRNLETYCLANKVNYINEPIVRTENMLHGAGHLNEKGNHELGELIFKACNTFFKR